MHSLKSILPSVKKRKRHIVLFDRLAAFTTYGVFLAVLLPLALVILFSFNDSNSLSWPLRGLSLRWYVYIFSQTRIYQVSLNSLRLAFIVALISTPLGTLGGVALARFKFRGKSWLGNLRLLPIMMPWLLIALGLVVFLISAGVTLSIWSVAIGHVTVTLPFTLLIVQSRVATFDTRLEDASRDLGASWWTTYRRIVFPIISPAIRAAFFFSMIISFNEVIIAFFLAGYDTTLPVYMFGQFLRIITPEVNAISGVMVILAGVLLFFERMVTRALTGLRERRV